MKTYLIVYLGSTLLAIVTTPIVIRVAKRLHIVDVPGIRKVHSKAIPRIGGVAIFVSMIGLVIPVLLLPNAVGETFRLIQSKITALLAAAGFIFLVGLIDDVRGFVSARDFCASSPPHLLSVQQGSVSSPYPSQTG